VKNSSEILEVKHVGEKIDMIFPLCFHFLKLGQRLHESKAVKIDLFLLSL
jgi:hypothetical protein